MEMCHNATRLVLISPSKLKVWRFPEEADVDAYNDGQMKPIPSGTRQDAVLSMRSG
jgi:hypothetical protein